MQNTAYRFYRQVQENTATKYIPGVLASACEFSESIPCKNNQAHATNSPPDPPTDPPPDPSPTPAA